MRLRKRVASSILALSLIVSGFTPFHVQKAEAAYVPAYYCPSCNLHELEDAWHDIPDEYEDYAKCDVCGETAGLGAVGSTHYKDVVCGGNVKYRGDISWYAWQQTADDGGHNHSNGGGKGYHVKGNIYWNITIKCDKCGDQNISHSCSARSDSPSDFTSTDEVFPYLRDYVHLKTWGSCKVKVGQEACGTFRRAHKQHITNYAETVIHLDKQGGSGGTEKTYFVNNRPDLDNENLTVPTKSAFIVTYDSNGGSPVSSVTVRSGFEGYYTESNGEGTKWFSPDSAGDTMSLSINRRDAAGKGHITLYAKWSDGQTNLAGAPSRTGYAFTGWKIGDTIYSAGQSFCPASDVTAVARWTPTTYNVHFNANGGTGSMPDQELTYNVSCALSSNGFTRIGYTFSGWAESTSGAKVHNNGASVKNLANPGETKNLYAVWTANKYNVHFNANGGTGSMPDQEFTYDQTRALSANSFTRTGYSFSGWAESAIGTKRYSNGDSVKNLLTSGTKNLYAVWTANRYSVTLDSPGAQDHGTTSIDATFDSQMPSVTVPVKHRTVTLKGNGGTVQADSMRVKIPFSGYFDSAGKKYYNVDGSSAAKWDKAGASTLSAKWGAKEVTPAIPTRRGYTFIGWSTDRTASSGTAGYSVTDDVTLYAIWTANMYDIVYKANQGKEPDSIQQATFDSSVTVRSGDIVSRDNYHFAGWNTQADGKGDSYSAGDSFVYTFEGPLVLYAQWSGNVYRIGLESDGRTPGTEEIYQKYATGIYGKRDCASVIEGIEIPTKIGYNFAGYSYEGKLLIDAEGRFTPAFTNTTFESDTVLEASWEAKRFRIPLNTGGATKHGSDSVDVVYDSEIPEITVPEWKRSIVLDVNGGEAVPNVKNWRDFKGYFIDDEMYLDADGKGTRDWDVDIEYEDIDLKAKWEDTYAYLPECIRKGYVFKGWSSKDGIVKCFTKDELQKMGTGSASPTELTGYYLVTKEVQTLRAVWEKETYTVTYDCGTNGGTSESVESATLEYMDKVDLTPTASRDGWKFLGWNTDPEAREGLESLVVKGSDIVLYAIFSTKVKAKFKGLEGVTTISETLYGNVTGGTLTPPAISTEDGWKPLGWTQETKSDASVEFADGSSVFVKAGATPVYYARYSKGAKGTFIWDGDSATKSVYTNRSTFNYNHIEPGVVNPPNVDGVIVRDGMRPVGWLRDFNDWIVDYGLNDKIEISEDQTFYLLSSKDVVVQFKESEMDSIEGQLMWNTVEQKFFSTSLKTPKKEGYIFNGWEDSQGNLFNGDTPVSILHDEAFSAKWVPVKYTIGFDGNGASSGEMADIPCIYDVENKLPKNRFKREYTVTLDAGKGKVELTSLRSTGRFVGWSCYEDNFADASIVKNVTATDGERVTLKAVWTDTGVTLPVPSLAGYSFVGWSDGKSSKLFTGDFVPKGDCTLTAVYSADKSNVVVSVQGATNTTDFEIDAKSGAKMPELPVSLSKVFTVTLNYDGLQDTKKKQVGYAFKGIYSKPNGKGKQYYDENGIPVSEWDGKDGQTLYTYWEPASMKLPNPVYDGWRIKGWSDGTRTFQSKYTPDRDVTLTIVKERKEFALTLNPNGGVLSQQINSYASGDSFVLPVPSYGNKAFLGWYTNDGKQVSCIEPSMYGDLVLTAKWDTWEEGDVPTGNESIKEFIIPDGTTTIEDGFFSGCTNLESVVIPEGVVSIGNHAFKDCLSLKDVILPESLVEIGDEAFKNCTSVGSMTIPENVQSVGRDCFMGCDSLGNIVFRNPACSIYDSRDTIPKHTVIWGYEPSTAKEYAQRWGREFKSLGKAYTLKLNVTENNSIVVSTHEIYVAAGKSLPQSVKIPSRISNDGTRFVGYTLPDGLSSTKKGTETVTGLVYGDDGFLQVNNYVVTSDLELFAMWKAPVVSGTESHGTAAGEGQFAVTSVWKNGMRFIIDGGNACLCESRESITKAKIPQSVVIGGRKYSVTKIGPGAFRNRSSLTSVVIPKTVMVIGDDAFRESPALTSIKVNGNALKSVGKYALSGTGSRLNVIVADQWKRRYKKLFSGYGNVTLVI